MNLSMINECMIESSNAVSEAINMLYIKQQEILEYNSEIILSDYQCFQEGFLRPSSKDLDVFKFDNKHILTAIKYFNKAYAELPFEKYHIDEIKENLAHGRLDTKRKDLKYPQEFLNEFQTRFRNPQGYFEKGMQELKKQFDCKFHVYVSQKESTGTMILRDWEVKNASKLTISRKHGFQLDGLPITLTLKPEDLLDFAPTKHNLFGQSLVSVILHEVYHNIIRMVNVRNSKLHQDIKDTMSSVGNSKNIVSATANLSSFVERFTNMFNIKKKDIDKKRAINRLYVLSQIKDNPNAMKQFEEDIRNNKDETNNDEEIDNYIERVQKCITRIKIFKVGKMVAVACSILMAAVGFVAGNVLAITTGVIGMAIMSLSILREKVAKLLIGAPAGVKEEYFCDLFAAMYKLPIHIESYNRQVALNKNNREKMTYLRKMDQKISKLVNDVHPDTFDRELTSYRLAKQMLAAKDIKLKKAEKEYLKYIVDLHEGIEDIDKPHSERQAKKLDPEAAADLRKTMRDFVTKTGVIVTESFIMDFCNINGGVYYGS